MMENLILKHKLITYVPDKSVFNQRLDFGISAENTVCLSLDRQIIENIGYVKAPEVNTERKYSKDANAYNGDIYFFPKNSIELNFIDVKGTNFVSDYSMKLFRRDGWYLFNAFVESKRMQHFMIRNNNAFHEYALKYPTTLKNGEKGYKINFMDLPSDPKQIGLELYEHMDSYKYRLLTLELRIEYEKAGLPFDKIIKSVA